MGPQLTDARHFGQGQAVAVQKGDARLGKFNDALVALRADGTLEALAKKHFA
ncbi:hypothetical protein [Streptomyces sp. LaBMicrA B280]|uniref:hypothetical protein n=1 Tax=Streptomyces sp. LaBMicrA B280 TaxID=3391001 RepID=UPI003BA7B8B2